MTNPGALSGLDRKDQEIRVHMDDAAGPDRIALAIRHLGNSLVRSGEALVLLCIGTDRSIGDSLGPLVGSILSEKGPWPFDVQGTLERPVHAGNLGETIRDLHARPRRPLIVAVDACLGRSDSVGYVSIGQGPLQPGAGVHKNLPAVGSMYLTGVVNVGGFMEYFVLQNTRLSLVMRMAKTVSAGLGLGMTALARDSQAAAT